MPRAAWQHPRSAPGRTGQPKEVSVKFSFMSFSCPDMPLRDILDMARDDGYDGIEPRIQAQHKHGLELDATAAARQACRDASAETGVAVCCVATSCRYADPATRRHAVKDSHEAIDLARDVGAPCIRVFGGAIPESISREKAIEQVAGALAEIADHAAEKGVTVCMETHDDWCHPAHVAAVMQRVHHASVAVNWDIAHPVRRAHVSMDEAYETLKPWIRHSHFHDLVTPAEGRPNLVPVGEGDIDHRRAVERLQADAYQGFMSGEWINWQPPEAHLRRELATMKRYVEERG